VTRLEDKLREAYREAAGTVRPESIRALHLKATQRAAVAPARHRTLLVPLAAAASVAVIAVASFVVLPSLAGRAPGHKARAHRAQGPAVSRLAALPTYTVLNGGNELNVVVTATGRVAGRLRAPAGLAFATIAGTAGDRTFFAAADLNPQTSCEAFFYRFTLNADGQPSALTPLPVHRLPGLPTALAASADGAQVAYSVVGCASGPARHIGSGHPIGAISLVNLASGTVTRHWSYTLSEDYTTDLSMSADGSELGYSNYQNASSVVGRVLAARAPSGPDQRHSRIVARQVNSVALSGSGRLMYAITGARDHVLASYDTANGRQVQVLHVWPARFQPGPLVADPAGGFALLAVTVSAPHRAGASNIGRGSCRVVHHHVKCQGFTPPRTVFFSINLATGAATRLPIRASGPAGWGMIAW